MIFIIFLLRILVLIYILFFAKMSMIIQKFHFLLFFCTCFESNWSSFTYTYHLTAYFHRFLNAFLNYFLQHRFNEMSNFIRLREQGKKQKCNLYISTRIPYNILRRVTSAGNYFKLLH